MKDLSLAISILKDIKVDIEGKIDTLDDIVQKSSRINDVIETAEFATESLELQMTRLDQVITYLEQLNML
tara:strand:+ start:880 stop:1089 length:210 start_codon:yes stop_codon:yes gene_type:complete